MSKWGFGRGNQARRLFIQSVRKSGPDEFAGFAVEVMDKRVEQRTAILAVRGVHQHPFGFVHHDQMTIFKNDVERDILGLHRRSAGVIDLDLYKIVWPYAITDILETAVDLTLFGLDQLAKIHLAERRKVLQQKVLEPHFMVLGQGLYLDAVLHGIHSSVYK